MLKKFVTLTFSLLLLTHTTCASELETDQEETLKDLKTTETIELTTQVTQLNKHDSLKELDELINALSATEIQELLEEPSSQLTTESISPDQLADNSIYFNLLRDQETGSLTFSIQCATLKNKTMTFEHNSFSRTVFEMKGFDPKKSTRDPQFFMQCMLSCNKNDGLLCYDIMQKSTDSHKGKNIFGTSVYELIEIESTHYPISSKFSRFTHNPDNQELLIYLANKPLIAKMRAHRQEQHAKLAASTVTQKPNVNLN